jgi:cell filamentation protein
MAEHSRYSLSDAGANIQDSILKNKLGILNQKDLDDAETLLFSDAYRHFFDLLSEEKLIFSFALVLEIHAYFLKPLYSWAGKIRNINISKDGILFATADHIPAALKEFDQTLKTSLPKDKDTKRQLAVKLALIHCELNAIHPFREGNGRTIRLFLDLLASHIGYDPIDWSQQTQNYYIRACVKGMAREYGEMEKIIYKGLNKQRK